MLFYFGKNAFHDFFMINSSRLRIYLPTNLTLSQIYSLITPESFKSMELEEVTQF